MASSLSRISSASLLGLGGCGVLWTTILKPSCSSACLMICPCLPMRAPASPLSSSGTLMMTASPAGSMAHFSSEGERDIGA